jgi:urease accessory protein
MPGTGAAARAPATVTSGWEAHLKLGFTQSGERTVLTERSHTGPLRIQKPLYPEGDAICHAIIVHPPGGIAGGDTLAIDVSLAQKSHGLITTPGATKWYKANNNLATQRVVITVNDDAILEWLPQEAIIFNAAAALSESSITLDENALYLGWEILCFGRTASGESFSNGRYRQKFTIMRSGRPLWNELGTLEGGGPMMHSPIGLNSHTVAATLIAAGRDVPQTLLDAARNAIADHPGQQRIALTRMPKLIAARYLGDSSEEAKQLFTLVWQVLRPALAGRDFVAPRLWAT